MLEEAAIKTRKDNKSNIEDDIVIRLIVMTRLCGKMIKGVSFLRYFI